MASPSAASESTHARSGVRLRAQTTPHARTPHAHTQHTQARALRSRQLMDQSLELLDTDEEVKRLYQLQVRSV